METPLYLILITIHAVIAVIAVGTVTITDYLHLIGLRKKKLEKTLAEIYPNLSLLISISLILLFITGGAMLYLNPGLLESKFFITKAILVVLVGFNGIYLQRKVAPNLDVCVLKGTKHCAPSLLYSSAIFGSFSVVTWYSILILSFTKKYGYSLETFIITYLVILSIAICTAYFVERNSREWRD